MSVTAAATSTQMPASIRRRLLHFGNRRSRRELNGIAIEGLPSRSLQPCAHWTRGCRSLTRPTPKTIGDPATFYAQQWRCFAEPVTLKPAWSFASYPAGLRLPRARLCGSSTAEVLDRRSHPFRLSTTRQDDDPVLAQCRRWRLMASDIKATSQ